MQHASTPRTPEHPRRLRAVPTEPAAGVTEEHAPRAATPSASATRFSETVRAVVALARRRRLAVPVFRSPPRLEGIDRSIRRRPGGTVVVAVRRAGRPLAAVQADVIEGVVAANALDGQAADRFRHDAWAALQGGGAGPRRRATMESSPPARVA